MSTVLSEEVITLNEACETLPRIDGWQPHISTLWRWALRGCSGVRLEHCRIGGRILTSHQALARFADNVAAARMAALKRDDDPGPTLPRSRSERQRQRDIECANLSSRFDRF